MTAETATPVVEVPGMPKGFIPIHPHTKKPMTQEEIDKYFEPSTIPGQPPLMKHVPHTPDNPPPGFKADPYAKYKLLHGRHCHDDGTDYFSNVPGHDIVPQSFKHPMGLDRWPEKFLKLSDDSYSRAARRPETIEELRMRLAQMESEEEERVRLQSRAPGAHDGDPDRASMVAALEGMNFEELKKHAVQMEDPIDPSQFRTKKDLLAAVLLAEGLG